jgi:superfamily II DNA/RNA helicase
MMTDTDTGEDKRSFFYSKKTFAEIGVSPSMTGVLNSLNLEKPSKIQALSFDSIFEGKHCIGKT